MSFLDSIMGGGGGGDIPPSSKLRNLDITPGAFRDLRGPLAATVGGATSGTQALNLSGIPGYQGQYSAQATDQETALMNRLFGRAGGSSQTAGFDAQLARLAGGNTLMQQTGDEDILRTINGRYLNPESNPYLAASIESAVAPLRQEWENTILPNLKIGFTQAGQSITGFGSSPFDRAAALAGNEYGRQVEDVSTQIASQNYQAERDRMLQALGLGQASTEQRAGARTAGLTAQQGQQGLNQAERAQQTEELVTTLQSVALPRLIEQYGMDQGTQEYRNRLNVLMQLLGLQGTLATGTYTSPPAPAAAGGGAGNLLGGLGGLIGGGAQAYSASDRRLKTDIRPLGATVNGVPLYEFAYRWEPNVRRWGVMADEAPAYARVMLPSGFLAVHYDMLLNGAN